MNKKKRITAGVLFIVCVWLSGCGSTVGTGQQDLLQTEPLDANELLYITELDQNTEVSDADAVEYIDLSQVSDDFTIGSGGEYVLSGTLDHTLVIDAHDEIVHLFLDNVSIETTIGPAVNIVSAGKAVITLMEGTTNTFFDAAYYSDEELNAAISSSCDLTINGDGTMFTCGYYKDAIHSKDVCKLLGGQIQLMAKRYGIKGNDGILLSPSYLMIESEKTGCQTSKADKEGKGVIDIQGGEITVVAGEYAISSVSDVYIREGKVYLNSVLGNVYSEGRQYIAEGVIAYE